jgi:hypothetical protein
MKSPSPDTASRTAEAWWWRGSLILLAAAMSVYLFAPTEADPDLWGHLRFGLDTLDTGRIVRADIYSYLTGDQLWINHEWLSEAIMAMAFRVAGVAGLVAIKVGLGVSVAALLVWHLRTRGLSLLAAFLITAYAIAVMLAGFRSLRPQAFTYLAFLIVLLWLHRAERGRPRMLWLAVPLVAIWANLHGGFVAGLGVLGIWSAVRLIEARDVASLLPVALAGVATAVNPYGVGLWTFLWRTLGPRPDIGEWQPVSLGSTEGVAYLAVLVFGLIGVIDLWRRPADADAPGANASQTSALRASTPKADGSHACASRAGAWRWSASVLFLCGAALPFLARRHLPLFVLITMVFCAEHTAAAIARVVRRRWPGEARASSDRFRPVVAMLMVLQAIVLIAIAVPQLTQIRVDPSQYPVAATAWLVRSGVAANVAVDFDWGEYVIWHAGPRVKVSVDGRRETVYSDAAYDENRRLTEGADDWDRLLTRRPTDLALVDVRTRAFDRLAPRTDWVLLMHDDTSALFGRRDAAATAAVRATPVPAIDDRAASRFP